MTPFVGCEMRQSSHWGAGAYHEAGRRRRFLHCHLPRRTISLVRTGSINIRRPAEGDFCILDVRPPGNRRGTARHNYSSQEPAQHYSRLLVEGIS